MWFPENQNIDPARNVTSKIDTFLLTLPFMNDELPKVPATEDLTFIIPLGIDSHDRARNVNLCVLSILCQTDAKIHIHWADTEENIKFVEGMARFPTGTAPLVDIFRQKSETGENISLLPQNEGRNSEILDALADLFILRAFDNFKLSDSLLIGDYLVENAHGKEIPGNSGDMVIRSQGMIDYCRKLLVDRVKVTTYLRQPEEPFHRTRYLNLMLEQTTTEFVCNHDADILLPSFSLFQAMTFLRGLSAVDFVYPYSHMNSRQSQVRVFLEADGLQPALVAAISGDFTNVLLEGNTLLWNAAYGQSIFARTSSYKAVGGECEEFVSWGAEDVERYVRFIKFGYGVARVNDGNVFHLEHERKADSGSTNPYFEANEKLWSKLQEMNQKEIYNWFSTKDWVKEHKFELAMKRIIS